MTNLINLPDFYLTYHAHPLDISGLEQFHNFRDQKVYIRDGEMDHWLFTKYEDPISSIEFEFSEKMHIPLKWNKLQRDLGQNF